MEDSTLEQVNAWRKMWPHGKPTLEESSGSTCGAMDRAHAGAGLMAGLVTPRGTHIGTVCSEGLHLMERTHLGLGSGELQLTGRTHIREVHEELSPVGGIPCWSKGSVWAVLPQGKKKQQKLTVWVIDLSLHFSSHCTPRREEVEKISCEVKPGKEVGVGEYVLRFAFISHYPTLIWLAINQTNFYESHLFYPWW